MKKKTVDGWAKQEVREKTESGHSYHRVGCFVRFLFVFLCQQSTAEFLKLLLLRLNGINLSDLIMSIELSCPDVVLFLHLFPLFLVNSIRTQQKRADTARRLFFPLLVMWIMVVRSVSATVVSFVFLSQPSSALSSSLFFSWWKVVTKKLQISPPSIKWPNTTRTTPLV